MIKTVALMSALALAGSLSCAAQDVAHAVEGTVKKVDSTTKTVVVKTEDGTEHTFHYTKNATVDGAEDTKKATVDGLGDLKEGSKVAVHYTVVGGKETTHEIDKVGDDGLKASEGTVSHVDRGAKTIAVKTADGTEETFHMTDAAAKDTGKDIAGGTDKSVKVTVYYTEKAGVKTAHFVKHVF
jgi:Cu/Ag efflux protein CusF